MNNNLKKIGSRDLTERDYVILYCIGFFIFAIIYGQLSEGTFNDDDIGYYLRSRAAIEKPSLILSPRGPIFTFLYILPAQLGYFGMELMTALISAVTIFVTWKTAKLLNLAQDKIVLIFLSFQPLFFILSFAAEREPFCALLIILGIYYYLSEKCLISAFAFSLLPLVRMELAVLSSILFIILYYKEREIKILLTFALPPILWQIIGWVYFGDFLWLYENIAGTKMNLFYQFADIWHWPTMFIFIIGPVVFSFVIIAFTHDAYHKSFNILWFTLISALLLYTVLTIVPLGGPATNLRHLVIVSPVIAIISLKGYIIWSTSKKGGVDFKLTLLSLIFVIGILYFFLSYKMWGHLFLAIESEYSKLLIVCSLLGIYLIRSILSSERHTRYKTNIILPILIGCLTIYYTISTEPPLKLSDEHTTVKRIAEWFNASEYKENPIYTNHSWFYYFIGQNPFDKEVYPLLTQEVMRTSPKGSIMIWEPHYGARLKGNVPYEALVDSDNFEGIGALYSPDSSFMTAVFIKK
ncbi:MAG: hypothetical protein IID03_12785 [Candidatus Dadabacteria bacterium]|nr:hypothetical protein [Candidatus Dadabacteria bacterium]